MSYARFGADSDVYVINGTECLACRLTAEGPVELPFGTFNMRGNTNVASAQEMLDHLQAHVNAGHRVPKDAFRRLRSELS